MKVVKYLAVGALLTVLSAPVKAQTVNQATIDQVEQILNSQAPDADKQIAKLAKACKKDAATVTAIGRMYYYAKNYEKASEYADKAKVMSKYKFGGAYVLSGDIAAANDDGGKAAEDYQQAQYLDPTNPDGYVRYAYLMRKSGLNASLQVLETLKQNNPEFDTNLTAAEICKADNPKKAVEFFKKADKTKMTEKQLAQWALDFYQANEFDESIEITKVGNQRFPNSNAFNRLGLYSYVSKKDFANAVECGEKLFAKDDVKLLDSDYNNLAAAYRGTEQYDKAAQVYMQYSQVEGASDRVLALAADMYSKGNNNVEAVKIFNEYLNGANNATLDNYKKLVTYEFKKAGAAFETEGATAFDEIQSTLSTIEQKFPETNLYVLQQKGRIGVQSQNTELTKTSYEQLCSAVEAVGINDTNKHMVTEAYINLMAYNLQTAKDYTLAKEYALKVLEVDPTNETAQKVVDAIQ